MRMEEREQACLELIRHLPEGAYVLIGGYAASSFDFPRFSVDLDLVISEQSEKEFKQALEGKGFMPLKPKAEAPKDIYGGWFIRFEKADVKASVDLLVNSVISRQTGSSYSFDYLRENSEIREVAGFSSSLKARARVADREMLIALKANSMRLADMRDIVALCNGEVDVEKVLEHLKRCPRRVLLKNIDGFMKTLGSREYQDSLKGVFMISDKVYERATERTRTMFGKIREMG